MSEENPSADSELASAATATESSDPAPEAMSVPRQSFAPAVESDGTAESAEAVAPAEGAASAPEPVEVAAPEAEAPVDVAAPEAEAPLEVAEPTETTYAEPIAPAERTWAQEPVATAEPVTVPVFLEPTEAETPAAATLVGAPEAEAAPAAEPTAAEVPAIEAQAPAALAAAESPAAPAPVTPAVTPAPPRKKKRGLLAGAVFGLIAVVLVAAIGVLVYLRLYADPTKNAAAGNCLADLPIVAVGEDKEVTKARVVNCGDASATHIVEARINNKTEAEARSPEVCKAYPNSTFIFRAVPQGGSGYVLCLKELAN